MDGVVLDDEERAELAALRRRAFGPDADILDDPAALERLRELELVGLPAIPEPEPARLQQVEPEADWRGGWHSDYEWPDATAEDDDEPPLPGRPSGVWARLTSSRRGRLAALAAAGILVAAIAGGIGWGLAQPHPDHILLADGTHYTPSGQGTDLWLKQMYGITGAFRGHERYGNVHVFTGTARDGSECMVLMMGPDDAVGTSCSPRPLPASADLFVLPGWTKAYTGLDLPAGSVVRFVQSGDAVQVWVAVMPTSAPAL